MNPLRAGAKPDAAAIARVYDGVRDGSLPKAEWTHHAHLVFGARLIADVGLSAAEATIRTLISRYNEATGGVNDDHNGYHHTISIFFLRAIAADADYCNGAEGAARLLASPLAATDYPLRHYSREFLFSVDARRGWRRPDLAAPPFALPPEEPHNDA
jgi:hypothetical protein